MPHSSLKVCFHTRLVYPADRISGGIIYRLLSPPTLSIPIVIESIVGQLFSLLDWPPDRCRSQFAWRSPGTAGRNGEQPARNGDVYVVTNGCCGGWSPSPETMVVISHCVIGWLRSELRPARNIGGRRCEFHRIW